MHQLVLRWALLALVFCSQATWSEDPFSTADNSFATFTQQQPTFLPVDEAYPFKVLLNKDKLDIQWDIADGYYLYNERFNDASMSESAA